jgi:hypothetical protein
MDALGTCKATPPPPQLRRGPDRPYGGATDLGTHRADVTRVRDQRGGGVYMSRPDALNTLGAHNKPAEPLRRQCNRCDKLGALEPVSRPSGCGRRR